jgi:alpha-galactosidase
MALRAACVVASLFFLNAVRAQDLVGTWILQPTPGPDAIAIRLVFTQSGGRPKGTLTSAAQTLALKHLIVVGSRVSFSLRGGALMKGNVHGDDLKMLMSLPGTAAPYPQNFHRASAEDLSVLSAEPTVVFQKQPLPELRDLPDNGVARTPPMGVGNWVQPTDTTVRDMADWMVASGLRDAGYVYLQIDAGWQGRRDANGVLHSNADFPDMKALADYVHSRGLKLGLYSSPGPVDCLGYVGSYGHEQQDATTFAEWGVDYLKYDWCSAGRLHTTQSDMQALYQKMGQALQGTGRPIAYALCQYGLFDVGKWGRKVGANLWRTSNDIQDKWASMTDNGFEKDGDRANAGPGAWNDPDGLQVGKGGMSHTEYGTQMTLWAMLSAPLLVEARDNDLRHLDLQDLAILLNKEVIAIDQDTLGEQAHRVKRQGLLEVWSKHLSSGQTAVAFFNRSNAPRNVGALWSEVHLTGGQRVRDLWRGVDLGTEVQGYRARVSPHGAVLLVLTAVQ